MKTFIYSLMTDRRKGPIWLPFKFVLYLASLVYGLGILVRKLLYKFGIFKIEKAPLKVVSVGNLTLGGTGKTPFVIALAGIFKDELRREASVLIRGYGWDEQNMLKKNMPDTPILVGEDRANSSHKAVKLYGSEAAILDDGFQHWELGRDLDIVLIDSRNPFGNGHLFPRGVLRESVGAIKRADIVVFTKVDRSKADIGGLKTKLDNIKSGILFVEVVHKPKHFYEGRAGKIFGLDYVKGKKVMLLSSIGDPSYFEETVQSLGANVAGHFIFPDHHNYRYKDIEKVTKKCDEKSFDLIITTEKDTVKLDRLKFAIGYYTLLTLAVELEITKGKESLVDRLNSIYLR